jgi:hypothetical protein
VAAVHSVLGLLSCHVSANTVVRDPLSGFVCHLAT